MIYENLKEKTIIYVTHKLSTVMMADNIIFINNGMVDESSIFVMHLPFTKFADMILKAKNILHLTINII